MESDLAASLAHDHRWIRLRYLGWGLMGAWQVLAIVQELVDIGLGSHLARAFGAGVSLVGLALVAAGFEQIVESAHRRAGEVR